MDAPVTPDYVYPADALVIPEYVDPVIPDADAPMILDPGDPMVPGDAALEIRLLLLRGVDSILVLYLVFLLRDPK